MARGDAVGVFALKRSTLRRAKRQAKVSNLERHKPSDTTFLKMVKVAFQHPGLHLLDPLRQGGATKS